MILGKCLLRVRAKTCFHIMIDTRKKKVLSTFLWRIHCLRKESGVPGVCEVLKYQTSPPACRVLGSPKVREEKVIFRPDYKNILFPV